MNMMVHYDIAMKALSTALSSEDVSVVLKSRDDLELMKLRAKQVKDRRLLADATEFQMRVERWLGKLIVSAKDAGQIAEGRPRKDANCITLKEIGIDAKLSSKAQRAAALNDSSFNVSVSDMRSSIVGGKAKLVNAVNAAMKYSKSHHHDLSAFDFELSDRTHIGRVKLGKCRSRINQLLSEVELLEAVLRRAGPNADMLATVEQTVSAAALREIIMAIAAK